jgi:hypothetical protein
MTKAPLDGAGTGTNPTDRGKKGTKRNILTDGIVVDDGSSDRTLKLLRTHEPMRLLPYFRLFKRINSFFL